jgi:hypothetical protein
VGLRLAAVARFLLPYLCHHLKLTLHDVAIKQTLTMHCSILKPLEVGISSKVNLVKRDAEYICRMEQSLGDEESKEVLISGTVIAFVCFQSHPYICSVSTGAELGTFWPLLWSSIRKSEDESELSKELIAHCRLCSQALKVGISLDSIDKERHKSKQYGR